MRFTLPCLLAGVTLFLSPLFCFAALGGDVSSVIADQAHVQGTMQSRQMSTYAVHEIHPPSGAVIREYLSPAGKVFAVSWQGNWPPDMHQLLGQYFQEYVNAVKAQSAEHPGRHPVHIVLPDMVFEQSAHLRSFAGKAYLPDQLPAGVQAEAIQ
jgi:hypothetical protein